MQPSPPAATTACAVTPRPPCKRAARQLSAEGKSAASVMCQPWGMVTLTDISALEKMAQDGLLAELGSPRSGEGLPWGETSMRAVHNVNLPALGTCLSADAPAHVLVSSPRERVRSGTVVSHVWSGPLPDRSLFRLSDNVLMASPGLVLAQMATSTPCQSLPPWSWRCAAAMVELDGHRAASLTASRSPRRKTSGSTYAACRATSASSEPSGRRDSRSSGQGRPLRRRLR